MRYIFSFLLAFIFMSAGWPVNDLSAGEKAPDFSLSTLQGEKVSLSSYNGKVVVIGFVDTCDPCKAQAQELEKLRSEYIKDPQLVVLGIVFEEKKETEKLLKSMNPKAKYPLLLDPKRTTADSFALRGEPQVVIVDSKGGISFKGYLTKAEKLSMEVKTLLKR